MARIFIDNKKYEVAGDQNLLAACLSLGFDLPYFCWHPEMHSVGACRQCAVKEFKDEHDRRGKIVMACMTAVSDGMRISIEDPEARAFRADVIEWLMLSHPHDCPVCDEGGECHLQDMTVMTGHTRRGYRGGKRTFKNQDLGPFVNHEMNRCIQCYRCLRFYRDYAGGEDFAAFSLRNHVYFGRRRDGVLANEFSGNLVEICPTGVFTDKSLKHHYTRKWDLETAPSICVNCALGCNTIPGSRYGSLRRIRNRFNSVVNGYFLCDRGRYGYEFVNAPRRLRQSLSRPRSQAAAEPLAPAAALARFQEIIAASRGIVGIGSPRASLEANYALRTLAGPERFAAGMADAELPLARLAAGILREGPARSASLGDVRASDAVLVLGEDVNNFAPLLALALRQSVRQEPLRELAGELPHWDDAAVRRALQDRTGPLYLATPAPLRLDTLAAGTLRAAPDDIARLGFAVAAELSQAAPRVKGLSSELRRLAAEIAAALAAAARPLVIAGTGLGSKAVLQAAANIARALGENNPAARICLTLPEANSMGAALLGGGSLSGAVAALESGDADTVVILENDLTRRADPFLFERLQKARHVIAIDYLETLSTERASLALAAAPFSESSGTLVSSEGRAQRFFKVTPPRDGVRESWHWLGGALAAAGSAGAGAAPWETLDDLVAELAGELPDLKGIVTAAPGAGYRSEGGKVARQSFRYSGRTAISAEVDVKEPQPPDDPDSPLTFSMEGFQGEPAASLIPRYWSPGWNSVQALNKFQAEVGGPLRGGDPGVRLIEPGGAPGAGSSGQAGAAGAGSDGQAGGKPPGEYFSEAPPPFTPQAGEWLIVPLYHIFGSEELSVLSPGIRELAPEPYLALAPGDAAALGLEEAQPAELILAEGSLELPVRLIQSLPPGTAGVPVYLPALEGMVVPGSRARILAAADNREETS